MCTIVTTDINERKETYQFPNFDSALSMLRGLYSQPLHVRIESGESGFMREHDGRLPQPIYPTIDTRSFLPPKR
jgi:hypothetical protein